MGQKLSLLGPNSIPNIYTGKMKIAIKGLASRRLLNLLVITKCIKIK